MIVTMDHPIFDSLRQAGTATGGDVQAGALVPQTGYLPKFIPEIQRAPINLNGTIPTPEFNAMVPTIYRSPVDPYPRVMTPKGEFCIVPSSLMNRFSVPADASIQQLAAIVERLGRTLTANIPDGAGTILPADILSQRAPTRAGASPFSPGGFIVASAELAETATQGEVVAQIEFSQSDLEKMRGATVCDVTFSFTSNDPLSVPWNSLGASFLLYGDAVPELRGYPLAMATTVAQAGGTARASINRYIPAGATPRMELRALAGYTGSPEGARVVVMLSAGQDCAVGLGSCSKSGCGCGCGG